MSIVKLRKGVRKQIKFRMFGRSVSLGSAMQIVFYVIVLIFVVGTYYMYGPGGGGGGAGPEGQRAAKLTQVVAKVDGRAIARMQYQMHLALAERYQGQNDITRLRYLKLNVLDSLIDQDLKRAAARAEGIRATNADIQAKKDEIVEDIIQNQYSNPAVLRKTLKDRNISLDQFKRELRSSDRIPSDDDLREQILTDKLQESVESQVQPTEQQIRDSYREVKASHILIDPKRIMQEANAERAAAAEKPEADPAEGGEESKPDEPAGGPPMTEEEAKQKAREIAEGLKKKIDEGADFAKLAEENSDDPGSASQGGDLGWFTRDRMVKPFADTAFALKPGQVSAVIETPFGFHIIKVEATRTNLPEDFEKEKARYTEEVTQRLRDQAWSEYEQQLKDAATIDLIDPELKAYRVLQDDPVGGVEAAAKLLQEAAEADPNNASARYELAMIYDQAGQKDEAIKLLTDLVESDMAAQSPQAHLQLGKLLKDSSKKKEALDQFKAASEWATGFDYSNYFIHMELKDLFKELGAAEDATGEQTWMDEFMQQQQLQGGTGSPGVIQVN